MGMLVFVLLQAVLWTCDLVSIWLQIRETTLDDCIIKSLIGIKLALKRILGSLPTARIISPSLNRHQCSSALEQELPARYMIMPTERSFGKGSECPRLQPGRLRLYSMRFCPFAQRTRLLLEHKNISYETVNINLKHKPDWFIQRNPLGLVPVLEHDGKVVYESMVCNEYLEEIYPEPRCSPTDPYLLARDRMVVHRSDWFLSRFYKVLLKGGSEAAVIEDLGKSLDVLEEELRGRGQFFAGRSVGNLDFLIWPWVERLGVIEVVSGFKVTPDRFPRLAAWITDMYNFPAVKKTAFDTASHIVFFRSLKARNPNYDFGLPDCSKL